MVSRTPCLDACLARAPGNPNDLEAEEIIQAAKMDIESLESDLVEAKNRLRLTVDSLDEANRKMAQMVCRTCQPKETERGTDLFKRDEPILITQAINIEPDFGMLLPGSTGVITEDQIPGIPVLIKMDKIIWGEGTPRQQARRSLIMPELASLVIHVSAAFLTRGAS